MAEAAVGIAALPGAGGAIARGAVDGIEADVTVGAKQGVGEAERASVESGLREGVTDVARDQTSDQAQQAYQNHHATA
ncbi:hypothetical protein OVY01_07480 [Robbsia sp. Bb-Pol-6]|uniref:Uncharacterized protein n=1 Tax=Robbsia betulipollinis TaxID=2981849 RepID=A0ABT3ZL47_9BURK|nr:hypothetical protein [Robbsia betulipollinis]MCY0387077.1 hypothetical protein [Robbsia betulipollinis]